MSQTSLPLAGKVALVTAAARTLGAVIASGLALAGARTALHYHRSRQAAESLAAQLCAQGCQAVAFGADGQDPAQVRALAAAVTDTWGGVDILVNKLGPYIESSSYAPGRSAASPARHLGWTLPVWDYHVGPVEGPAVQE